MKPQLKKQAEQEMQRARRALRAAEVLLAEKLYDDCVSRASSR